LKNINKRLPKPQYPIVDNESSKIEELKLPLLAVDDTIEEVRG